MSIKEINLDPVAQSAASSLDVIISQGLLGAIAIVAIFLGGLCVWIVIRQANACFQGTKEVVSNNTKAVNDLKDSNKEALHGVQMAIARLEGRIDLSK